MTRRLRPILSVALVLAAAAIGMLPVEKGKSAEREKHAAPSAPPAASVPDLAGRLQSLDGRWQIAKDPADVGKANRWYTAAGFPLSESRPILVPGNIYEAWCRYNRVAWYGRTFSPAMPKTADMRYYLRFGSCEYSCDVWLNETPAGPVYDAELNALGIVDDASK
jgi:hypothetical protein